MICTCSGCHHSHLQHLLLQTGLAFWYQFTEVVLEYGSSNECSISDFIHNADEDLFHKL